MPPPCPAAQRGGRQRVSMWPPRQDSSSRYRQRHYQLLGCRHPRPAAPPPTLKQMSSSATRSASWGSGMWMRFSRRLQQRQRQPSQHRSAPVRSEASR